MYATTCKVEPDEALDLYAAFLADIPRFVSAMRRVVAEWPLSCEHFLSNEEINRIAWLGQSSMCIATGIPSRFKAGFKLLSPEQQSAANAAAYSQLADWLDAR